MDNVKLENIIFWTRNVPGIDNQVTGETVGSLNFFKKVDFIRYKQEPYILNYFDKILKPGLSSLEIGCGLGSDMRTFSAKGIKVIGIDYSPENAYLSQVGLRVCGLEGSVFCGDAESLPFSDNCFDLVFSYGCLHHTPDTQESINEIFRILRPGGKIMIMLYYKGYQYMYILGKYFLSFKWIDTDLQTFINHQYDQTPLSQMFSKRRLCRMFSKFNNIDIKIENFGGIQFHPILKYVWKIFTRFPYLKKRFGGFAIIFAQKPGDYPLIKSLLSICCPACHSRFDFQKDVIKCTNLTCRRQYFYYKEEIPILYNGA